MIKPFIREYKKTKHWYDSPEPFYTPVTILGKTKIEDNSWDDEYIEYLVKKEDGKIRTVREDNLFK